MTALTDLYLLWHGMQLLVRHCRKAESDLAEKVKEVESLRVSGGAARLSSPLPTTGRFCNAIHVSQRSR